jgi:hypothetical protein
MWLFTAQIVAEPSREVPSELIWETEDGKSKIHLITDLLTDIPYIVIDGETSSQVERELRHELEFEDPHDLVGRFKRSRAGNERRDALARLSIAAPRKADPAIVKVFEEAIADPDAEMRRLAIWGTGYAAWPAFRALLERVRANDDVDSIREDAGYVLAAFDQERVE